MPNFSKVMKSVLLITSLLASLNCQAGLKDDLRNLVSKIFGDELTARILGPSKVKKYQLPKIPDISKDTKSLQVYSRPKDPNASLAENKKIEQFNYSFIVEIYEVVKDKKPTESEASGWMNALSQGGTREGVYRAVVLDNAYGAKEGMEFPLNDSAIDFSVELFLRFLDRSLVKEQLEKSNFYTLKRVAAERVLDILDAFIFSNREHLYDWFAIFSGEMAAKYPQAFKKKWRKNPSVEYHRAWATKVPEQVLISEVVIKLHLLYNQFR